MTKLFSEDYEKALLGSMLLDNSIISDVMSLVKNNILIIIITKLSLKKFAISMMNTARVIS